MEDLFEMQRMQSSTETPVEDYEYRMWAERVIREVSEDVARDEKQAHKFITAWVRWNDVASLLNVLDLALIRRGSCPPTELTWHQTVISGLISLGGLIREWAPTFDQQVLDLAGYNDAALTAKLQSLQDSYEDWHVHAPLSRVQAIQALVPN